MGKPSGTRISQNSGHSLHMNSSKKSLHALMNSFKKGNKIKRMRRKHRQSIQRLFENLRNDSSTTVNEDSSSSSVNNTVICLDDTVTETPPPKKRKLSPNGSTEMVRLQNKQSTTIVLNDTDDLVTNAEQCTSFKTPRKNSTPIHCSTPISNHKPGSIKDCNISGLSNSNNNLDPAKNLNKEITNLTKEINRDSYFTIDLTTETIDRTKNSNQNTVIDLVNTTETKDCTFVSVSNASLSMSGDSDVTVLNKSRFDKRKKDQKMRKFAEGIAKLNASEKGRLLELITQNIFSGCEVPNVKNTKANEVADLKDSTDRATETAEDTYIREVILGQAQSRNSIGSNIYNPEKDIKNKSGLRMIVIDGSNVAMEHGQHRFFSVKGLSICIDYFVKRGHIVKAFVPRFRCKFGKSSDPRLLDSLERKGLVVYTPSREVQGKFITPYDDRYIVQCAAEFDGVIVSGDNYRDLLQENQRWRSIIETRLLPFTWVNDMIMFPRDPLGRNGPTLEAFLRHPLKK